MSQGISTTLKIIGTVITGVLLVAGTVTASRDYTDNGVKDVRIEQSVLHSNLDKKMETIQGDMAEVKTDMAVVRTILEERFQKRK